MKNHIKKLIICLIFLTVITSFSLASLSLQGINGNVNDYSYSVSSPSTQDIFWPSNSSEWTEVAPESQGLDSDKIADMFKFIKTNRYLIQSIIIVRNGYLLTYEYLKNFRLNENKTYPDGTKLHAQYSTTKSVISILIGIALQEGFLDNLNQTLYEFFAHIWDPSFVDSELKKNITIEQLLTMTSGYGYYQIPNGDFKYAADFIPFLLDEVPLEFTPGEEWVYSNEGVDLLSGIIANVTGTSTEEFAKEYLFTPLGISEDEFYWLNDSKGNDYGGSGLECSPKVQAKLGMLSLNNGTWNGTQIVELNFIKNAKTSKVSWGSSEGYGYLWWIMNGSLVGYYAAGAAGQTIYVIPEYNITVGFTGIIIADEGDVYGTLLLNYILQFAEDNAPEWDPMPEDQLVRVGDPLFYDVNASDTSGVDYSINDTVNFNITSEGLITNSLSLSVGAYPLEIRAYNTFNNNLTATINIRVAEDIAPEWDEVPEDQTILEREPFLYDVNASCTLDIGYSINDTVNFNITPEGIITNSSSLSVGVYLLEIRAYNPFNNSTTATINIRVNSKSSSNGIPGFDFNMILFMIIFTSAVIVIRRKKNFKNL